MYGNCSINIRQVYREQETFGKTCDGALEWWYAKLWTNVWWCRVERDTTSSSEWERESEWRGKEWRKWIRDELLSRENKKMRLDQKFQGSYSLSFHYLNYHNTNNPLRRRHSLHTYRVCVVRKCAWMCKCVCCQAVFMLNDIIDVYVQNECWHTVYCTVCYI